MESLHFKSKILSKEEPSNNYQKPDLKIESGIALPPIVGYWRSQAARMKVGDCVFFKEKENAISLRYALIYIGAKVAKRYMHKEKGWRVWRLEQK